MPYTSVHSGGAKVHVGKQRQDWHWVSFREPPTHSTAENHQWREIPLGPLGLHSYFTNILSVSAIQTNLVNSEKKEDECGHSFGPDMTALSEASEHHITHDRKRWGRAGAQTLHTQKMNCIWTILMPKQLEKCKCKCTQTSKALGKTLPGRVSNCRTLFSSSSFGWWECAQRIQRPPRVPLTTHR